ncbi:MAG: hypothetical protein J6M17_01665 [Ruminococcus sp.]|nr:hypothetical protein [Ruminococcus sp.]
MQEQKYDEQKRKTAGTKATLRAVVAGYFIFLGYKIITNKETTMSHTTAYLLGGIFIAAALGFGIYTLMKWRSDIEESKLTDDQAAVSDAEPEVENDDGE